MGSPSRARRLVRESWEATALAFGPRPCRHPGSASPRHQASQGGTHMKTSLLVNAGICAALALTAVSLSAHPSRAQGAPHYEADLSWPKPLPDHWILGGLG